jgi:hypothetical protein
MPRFETEAPNFFSPEFFSLDENDVNPRHSNHSVYDSVHKATHVTFGGWAEFA